MFDGGDNRIMAVSYTIAGNSSSSGTPHPWSDTMVRRIGVPQNFDVALDGKGIIAFQMAQTAEGTWDPAASDHCRPARAV